MFCKAGRARVEQNMRPCSTSWLEEAWIRQGVGRGARATGRGAGAQTIAIGAPRAQRAEVYAAVTGCRALGKLVFEAQHVTHPSTALRSLRVLRPNHAQGSRGIIGPSGCGRARWSDCWWGTYAHGGADQARHQPGTGVFRSTTRTTRPTASIIDNVTGGGGRRHRAIKLACLWLSARFPVPLSGNSPVSMLSGGNEIILLARLFARPSNLLVMDEPTTTLMRKPWNSWRSWSRNIREPAAGRHDRDFLDNVVTSTLCSKGAGRVAEYVGGYSD